MLEVPCAFAPARSVVIHVVFDEMGAPLFFDAETETTGNSIR